jgi:hypothetical protein
MKRIIFSDRKQAPAFYDMGCRFAPYLSKPWYGGPFRIGDRAAAHVWLADWRLRNPIRRLVVVEDSLMAGTEHSRALPGSWLFKDIADELWVVEEPGEVVKRPEGQTLYHVTMWRIWRWLMFNKIVVPTIRPMPESVERMKTILDRYKVPSKYITVQPLFDATYDKFRNANVTWWASVLNTLQTQFPVVVLGLRENADKLKVSGHNLYPIWQESINAMESLAIISRSSVHVGGATGLTLWAPIFQISTLACYIGWSAHPGKKTDTRPLSFGAPVVFSLLDGDVKTMAVTVEGLYNGRLRESTPVS